MNGRSDISGKPAFGRSYEGGLMSLKERINPTITARKFITFVS
jgi:hypothetical protein